MPPHAPTDDAPPRDRRERARALILRHGWNATAYQILNPGIGHWFAPAGVAAVGGDAVIGYVTARRVRVVAGAPICDAADLPAVLESFAAGARAAGERVCYVGAAARVMAVLGGRPDHAAVVLGAQPVWEPSGWAAKIDGTASLRAQINRARNKGVRVSEWPTDRAEDAPELRRLLAEWLDTRGLPPLRFLVEPQTLGVLDDRRVFVAERDGTPVGFVTLSPIPRRDGWLTEQFVRGPAAPNGTTERLIDAAVRAVAAEGARYLTMGLVPLSRRAEADTADSGGDPLWLRLALAWARAHGRRFYDFDGLDRFKAKFRPDGWEPIHAVSDEPRFSFRTLHAIADAFSPDGSAVRALSRGLRRAARQEARWALERRRIRRA